MKASQRPIWLVIKDLRFRVVGIAIGVMAVLTLFAAPNNSQLRSGSTFNPAPEGYAAWYTLMEQQGTTIRRWQRPFEDLLSHSPADDAVKSPLTLVRINSSLSTPVLAQPEQDWVKQGNTIVSLGVQSPVTQGSFHTLHPSPVGKVKIDTRRRLVQPTDDSAGRPLLGDRFGAVVWQQNLGKGQIILVTTPHLAANAYQDHPSNYQFLAQLVTQDNHRIWIDEYIHGYAAADVRQQEAPGNWAIYLAKTPLLPVLCQAGILLLLLIWAQNRRLGPPLTLVTPGVNNSEAYIQAFADVLYRAKSSEFVLDVVGKAEQRRVQVSLGLGHELLEHSVLIDAWVQQTGHSPGALEQMLRLQSAGRRVSQADLLIWLRNVETVRRYLTY